MHPSLSEDNGLATLSLNDKYIYSAGISTGGQAEMRMARIHPDRRIIATTIDPQGAAFAQKRIAQEGLSHQIQIRLEDVTHPLPHDDGCFDFIYARLILHYLTNTALETALRGLHRILKSNGKLFVVVRSPQCEEAQNEHAYVDTDTGLTHFYSNGNAFARYFHTEESIQTYLTTAGFNIQQTLIYQERLCIDFERKHPSTHVDTLVELIATK